jgi:hypothetical protein
VKRHADQPFVMLGVNSDQDRAEIKKIVVQEDLSWASWWDGSIDGPIHKQWNITERPCVYVIDAQGIIRYKKILGDELDAAVEELLKEMKQ